MSIYSIVLLFATIPQPVADKPNLKQDLELFRAQTQELVPEPPQYRPRLQLPKPANRPVMLIPDPCPWLRPDYPHWIHFPGAIQIPMEKKEYYIEIPLP
jgi:hypothetical protein